MDIRENYKTALRGEVPEWVPHYGTDVISFLPSAFQEPYGPLYGEYFYRLENGLPLDDVRYTDGFGCKWMLDEYGAITVPGEFVMEDICDWREKFIFPDISDYDWEAGIAEASAGLPDELAKQAIIIGPFSQMVNAMGFENALVAIVAEPEETIAFIDRLTSFFEYCLEQTLTRYQYDSVQIFDDFANAKSLFFSPDTYREIFKPAHKRLVDCIRRVNPDMLIEFHLCGRCDAVIDDIVEIGINAWQPAQPINDLEAIRNKYGAKFVLEGCWDNVVLSASTDITEEEVRQSVRDVIDKFAPGGGYLFWEGGPVGTNPDLVQKLGWANDEAAKYGKDFYKKSADC